MSATRIDTALFALGFVLAGLVLLALAWSGTGPYEAVWKGTGRSGTEFMDHATSREVAIDMTTLVEFHRRWAAYVTGGVGEAPSNEFFTPDEYAHMADVRRVFDGAKLLVPAGLFLMAFRLQRARRHSLGTMLRLARNGALVAGVAVAAIGLAAAVAFEPMFLLFHYVFFPQGNFLFDPRASNLVRLYPDWYWEGITLRIGISFLALAALLALASALGLRRTRATRLAAE